jgi:hypothetical protein
MSPKHFRPLNQGFQLSNLLCLTWQDITEVKKKGSSSHCHRENDEETHDCWFISHFFDVTPCYIFAFLRYTACSTDFGYEDVFYKVSQQCG